MVREWVSAPPIWLGATPAQEQAYLEMWRQRRLAEERRQGEYEEMLERDPKEKARQAAATQAAAQPPAPALPAPAQPDMTTLWNSSFAWAGPAPTLIDLTDRGRRRRLGQRGAS